MSRMVGGTFGVAAMGALITGLGRARIDDLLPADARRAARSSWPTRSAPAAHAVGGQVGDAVNQAFVYALNDGLRIGAAVAVLGALLAWLLIADRAEAPAEVEGAGGRSSAPRPKRRWPRPSERDHCPAPPLASAAPDAGSRHRRPRRDPRAARARGVLLAGPGRPQRRRSRRARRAARDPRPRHRGQQGVRPAPQDRRLRRARAHRLLRRARRPTWSRSTSTSPARRS